jgi:hypothetical protein
MGECFCKIHFTSWVTCFIRFLIHCILLLKYHSNINYNANYSHEFTSRVICLTMSMSGAKQKVHCSLNWPVIDRNKFNAGSWCKHRTVTQCLALNGVVSKQSLQKFRFIVSVQLISNFVIETMRFSCFLWIFVTFQSKMNFSRRDPRLQTTWRICFGSSWWSV